MNNLTKFVLTSAAVTTASIAAYLINRAIKDKHTETVDIDHLNDIFNQVVEYVGDVNSDEFANRVNEAIEAIVDLELNYKDAVRELASVPNGILDRIEYLEVLETFYWTHSVNDALKKEGIVHDITKTEEKEET